MVSGTKWDDKVSGFHDDVNNLLLANMLEIPSQALHLTGGTVVPLTTEMQDAWDAETCPDPAATMLGPFHCFQHH
jgi:hypothetical protein